MACGRNWLYERLRSKLIAEDERERWNSLISRLKPLTTVDKSTKKLGHECPDLLDLEAAQDHRHKPISRAGEQGQGGVWTAPNSPKTLVRRNVELYEKYGRNQKS